ncbi:transcriptional adapter 1-like isoform X2 [Tachypleus tridentatus]|uniref:transcriptional adapter 1-like isoform X2 n=1 Tax=Tachypleus tridentatus TaxID=6853 RepID=UPI003FD4181A
MVSDTQLNFARKKLFEALGDDFKMYLNSMKLWFRQKTAKETFDADARKLLTPDTIHLHNEFLLAMLNKCQSLVSTHVKDSSGNAQVQNKDKQKKGKLKKKIRPVRATFEHRLQPANTVNYTPQAVAKDPQDDSRLSFCSRDYTLPEVSMVHGRMFVTAWDIGLDGVEDGAVKMVMLAVRQQLKGILVCVFRRRSTYRLREGKFRYAMGVAAINPYLRNSYKTLDSGSNSNGDHLPSIKPTIDCAEVEAVLETACGSCHPPLLPPVCPLDLLEALQVHKSCINSHSVYSVNLERLIAKIWHPTQEVLDQENLVKQEETIKKYLAIN